MGKFIEKLDKAFSTLVEWVTFLGFVVMVLLVFINVVGRYVFRMGIVESEEIARILFVWITYLGAILCFRSGSHVTVDILLIFLHGIPRKIVDLISNVLVSVILVIVTKYSINLVKLNINTPLTLTHIPTGLVQAVIPASMIIMLIYNVIKMFGIFLKKPDEQKE